MNIKPTALVVGLGTMGSGIAWLLARAGWKVEVADATRDSTSAGLTRIKLRAATDSSTADDEVEVALRRVRPIDDLAVASPQVQLVIEAVPEDQDIKRRVLTEIAEQAPDSAIIATNTSAIPIEHLAAFLPRARRRAFVGIHFFNPADVVPGVEVVPHDTTAASVVQAVLGLLNNLGKVATVVTSSPGFIANRLQFALFLEAAACVEEGLASPEDVDRVVRSTFGLRLPAYGPFEIADMAGLDVYVRILETLQDGLGTRFAIPDSLRNAVNHGHLGLKSGKGYSTYGAGEQSRLVRERDAKYGAIAQAAGRTDEL